MSRYRRRARALSAGLWSCLWACALVTLVACGSPHDENFAEVTSAECSVCHLGSYQAVTNPNHIQMNFPQTCANCHVNDFWRPALADDAPHPFGRFPLSGEPHGGFECVDCHDPAQGSSLMGQNTNCVGCHTGAHRLDRMDRKHRDVEDYAAANDGSANFCFGCHPSGLNEES